jgi:hypothetical protein
MQPTQDAQPRKLISGALAVVNRLWVRNPSGILPDMGLSKKKVPFVDIWRVFYGGVFALQSIWCSNECSETNLGR